MAANPFTHRAAIKDTKCFYGRKRELRKVFGHIPKACCALVGDGKIGKSSFLHYIADPLVRQAEGLDSKKHIFVNFDFQFNVNCSRSGFWRQILQDISRQIDDASWKQKVASVLESGDLSKTAIRELMLALQGEMFKLFFLFDEFECITESPELFNADFLSELRYLTNHCDLIYVVATEIALQVLIPERFGSPFPNVFSPIHLGLLDEEGARALIVQAKDPVGPSLQEEEPFIVRLAGRHPFLTQLVCYHLFDSREEKEVLDKDDYRTVREDSLADAWPFFEGDLWPSLSEAQRQLLTQIAWEAEFDARAHRVVLRELERHKQYIRQQGGRWTIFCDLFRSFIRETQGPGTGPIRRPRSNRKPRQEYDDFEILVERRRPGEGYPVRVSSSEVGDESGVSAIDLDAMQDDLGRILSEETDLKFMRDFGGMLMERLLVGKPRRRFDEANGRIVEGERGLRVRLRIDPPELACLPWEFLYEKDHGRWLATSSSITLSRYVDAPEPRKDLAVQLPLNILFVPSNPTDLDKCRLQKLDLDAERRHMEEALADFEDRGLVTLETLPRATTQAIRRKLRPGGKEYHILHFSGHGFFADEDAPVSSISLEKERGYLLMQWAKGHSRFVHEETLADLLKDTGVRLVLLNACRTAASSHSRRFVGLATRLVRSGPPAVVAMQYSIYDDTAQYFTQEFYSSLVSGLPVDVCMAEARKAIAIDFDRGGRDWATPVLYMRSPNGKIFDIARA